MHNVYRRAVGESNVQTRSFFCNDLRLRSVICYTPNAPNDNDQRIGKQFDHIWPSNCVLLLLRVPELCLSPPQSNPVVMLFKWRPIIFLEWSKALPVVLWQTFVCHSGNNTSGIEFSYSGSNCFNRTGLKQRATAGDCGWGIVNDEFGGAWFWLLRSPDTLTTAHVRNVYMRNCLSYLRQGLMELTITIFSQNNPEIPLWGWWGCSIRNWQEVELRSGFLRINILDFDPQYFSPKHV